MTMTPQEYLTLQQNNKRMYEVAHERDKWQYLARMRNAEIDYIRQNDAPLVVKKTVSDQPLNFQVTPNPLSSPEENEDYVFEEEEDYVEESDENYQEENYKDYKKAKFDKPAENPELLFMSLEKITPNNFYDKVSVKDANGNSVDLKKLLGDNPEAMANLCNALNEALKLNIQKQFGPENGLEMIEDDKQIRYQRPADPKTDVEHIMKRAEYQAQQNQSYKQDAQQESGEEPAPPPRYDL